MALANILFLKIEAKKPCGGGELTSGQPTVCKQVQITLFTGHHCLLIPITNNLFYCLLLYNFFLIEKNLIYCLLFIVSRPRNPLLQTTFFIYYCRVPVPSNLTSCLQHYLLFIIILFSS
jgi:hypothetical protein